RPSELDCHVSAFDVAGSAQAFTKCGYQIGACLGRTGSEITDHRHRRLLPSRREGPCRRAADQRDELAPPHHSITSSARASSVGGTSRPSALAVLRLITSSYFVGACTGKSAGFSPLRMRSTYSAERRNWSTKSGP